MIAKLTNVNLPIFLTKNSIFSMGIFFQKKLFLYFSRKIYKINHNIIKDSYKPKNFYPNFHSYLIKTINL